MSPESSSPIRCAILALALAGVMAGCQSAPDKSAPSTPLHGAAIDAPAQNPTASTTDVPPASGLGSRAAPTDPQARAQMAQEAPAPVGRDGFAAVTFGELSDFVYETDMDGRLTPESNLPAEISQLDKTPVAVSGFVMPMEYKDDKVSSLILVRNQLLCCFGEEPKLNEWIFVNADPPVEAVVDVPVTLFGTFYASPDREENQVISLYRMQAQAMEAMK